MFVLPACIICMSLHACATCMEQSRHRWNSYWQGSIRLHISCILMLPRCQPMGIFLSCWESKLSLPLPVVIVHCVVSIRNTCSNCGRIANPGKSDGLWIAPGRKNNNNLLATSITDMSKWIQGLTSLLRWGLFLSSPSQEMLRYGLTLPLAEYSSTVFYCCTTTQWTNFCGSLESTLFQRLSCKMRCHCAGRSRQPVLAGMAVIVCPALYW